MKFTDEGWTADWLDDLNGWIISDSGLYLAEIVTKDSEGRLAPKRERVGNSELMALAPRMAQACQAAYENSCVRSETKRKWTARDQRVHEKLREIVQEIIKP